MSCLKGGYYDFIKYFNFELCYDFFNKSAATFKNGIFVHPPWTPNCMQNLKEGWKFAFRKMFDSYWDLLLISM